ncbi:MAG: response regulator transcription factor [Elusimicrobia bacterium]|nr:response regulator transcription factor [Elusimicrobiota bacterium]
MPFIKSLNFLAISDNPAFIGLLQDCAREGGYILDTVKTGAQGFKAIIAHRPDLLLLDTAVPDIGALSWLGILREMREGKDLPVIVAGENPGHEEIAGFFELGADDCVVSRHCDPREFSARIRATLRRHKARADQDIAVLALGPVELDPACHRCFVKGKEVVLRPREFELLEMLMCKAGRVLSRPYLLECVWGMDSSASTRAVDVTISRLRKALGEKAAGWIESVEKFGYRFSDPGKITR